MDTETPPNKQELLEALLDRGMIMVTLDARRAGVDVPERFQDDLGLGLNLSYRFGLPLEINAWGIRATLSFGGISHDCKIPWNAIYQVFSHVTRDRWLFPEDIPNDILEHLGEAGGEPSASQPQQKGRPRLSLVQGEPSVEVAPEPVENPVPATPAEEEHPPEEPPPAGGPRRGHLRRIK